jgi:group I intron endonuclease
MAKNFNFGEVYVSTCLRNDKSYVGQTTQGVSKRWALHQRCARSPRTPAYKTVFSKAIRKYGADVFEHQILSVAGSQAELDNLEKIWIILLQTKVPNGYNLADGGNAAAGHIVTPEVRARLSAKQIANWANPEYRAAHSGARAYHFRRAPSAETIAKRVAKMIGRKASAEEIAKRVAKTTGMKRSPEICAKFSASHLGKPWSAARRAAHDAKGGV